MRGGRLSRDLEGEHSESFGEIEDTEGTFHGAGGNYHSWGHLWGLKNSQVFLKDFWDTWELERVLENLSMYVMVF